MRLFSEHGSLARQAMRLVIGCAAYSVAALAAAQPAECAGRTAGARGIVIVSGQIEQPEQQVVKLRSALARHGLGPIAIDLRLVDESDPSHLAAQLDRADLDDRRAVVTLSGHIAKALTAAHLRSPTVFATILDPLLWGIVDDLGPRGINATGVSYSVDFEWKYLEYLRIAFPNVRSAGILADEYFFRRPVNREIAAHAKQRLGIDVVPFVAETGEELERAFASPAAAAVDAWIVPETPVVFRHEQRVLELVGRRHVPSIFGHPSLLAKGAIMTFGVEFPEMWDEIAQMVTLLCSGVQAREIPVVRPHRVFLGVSATNARSAGLAIDGRIYRLATFWH